MTKWELQPQQGLEGMDFAATAAASSGGGGGVRGVPGGYASVKGLLEGVKLEVAKEATRKGIGAAPLLPTIAAAGVAGTLGLTVPATAAAAARGGGGGGGYGSGSGSDDGDGGPVAKSIEVQKGLGLLKVKGEPGVGQQQQQLQGLGDRLGSPSVETPVVGAPSPSSAAATGKLVSLAPAAAAVPAATAALLAARSPFSSSSAQAALKATNVTSSNTGTNGTSPCVTTGVIQTPCQVQLAGGKVTAYVASIQSALAAAPAAGKAVAAAPLAAAPVAATAAAAATAALASGDSAAAGGAFHTEAWPLMASVAVREGVQEVANNSAAVLRSNSSASQEKGEQQRPVELLLSVVGEGEEWEDAAKRLKPAAAEAGKEGIMMEADGIGNSAAGVDGGGELGALTSAGTAGSDTAAAAAAAAAGGMAKSSSGASAEVLKTLTAAAAAAAPPPPAGHLGDNTGVTSVTGDKQELAVKSEPVLQKDQSVHLIDVQPLSSGEKRDLWHFCYGTP